ncbi:MAG: hypothetical protein IID37_12635 [Planctomycetes bacterium]|nr:hypothetical protein [Planctomycetota bacterium]
MQDGSKNNQWLRPTILLTCCLLLSWVPWPTVSLPAALILLLWFPGRSIARWIGLDRTTHGGIFVLASVALSLTVTPLFLDILWRQTHRAGVIGVCWWAVNVVVIVAARRSVPSEPFECQRLFTKRRSRRFFGLIILWLGACMVLSHWPTEWNGTFSPASPRDYIKHHAVLASLADEHLPLNSAFYADENGGPYYYYHYFYLVPATVRLLGGAQVPIALAYSLTMVAVMGVVLGWVYVLARRLTGGDASAIFAVFCVALIGGYDAIPVVIRWLSGGPPVLILDSWAPVPWRAHNLFTLVLWGPQHVLPLVTFLLGVWLLIHQPRARWWLVLGPIMGASVIGSSVYFALALIPAVGVWCAVEAYLDRRRGLPIGRLVGSCAAIAVLTALLSAVQTGGYLEMSGRFEAGFTTSWDRYPWALLGRLLPSGVAANLIDLPWIFLLEYGIRAVACVLVAGSVWRRLLGEPGLRLLVIASGIGMIAFLTVRSAIHDYDYGFKIGLLPSIALTGVVAGALVQPTFGRRRWWNPVGWRLATDLRSRKVGLVGVVVVISVVIGLPLGFYEAPGMALRRALQDNPLAAEAEAIAFVRDDLPADVVIQFDPVQRMATIQLLERQIGVMDPDNPEVNVFRPRDVSSFRDAFADIQRAASTPDAQEAYALLRRHQVTHVYVGTIERMRWKHLEKFSDSAYFSTSYRDSAVAVYSLNEMDADSIGED